VRDDDFGASDQQGEKSERGEPVGHADEGGVPWGFRSWWRGDGWHAGSIAQKRPVTRSNSGFGRLLQLCNVVPANDCECRGFLCFVPRKAQECKSCGILPAQKNR
jgi:hypothetical protein